MRWLLSTLCVVVLLLAVGCSRNEGPRSASAPPAGNSSSAGSDAMASAQSVDVELGEWFVRMKPSVAGPGMTHFAVTNTGKRNHSFQIRGQGIDQKTETLAPGKSTMLMVDLKPGEYETWCPIGKHKEQGMDAPFRVR